MADKCCRCKKRTTLRKEMVCDPCFQYILRDRQDVYPLFTEGSRDVS